MIRQLVTLICITSSLSACANVTDTAPLSAASKRAIDRGYWEKDPNWFISFEEKTLKGDLAWEEGVTRRDPSAVLKIGDQYHVWYTRSEGRHRGFRPGRTDQSLKKAQWDFAEVWHATSTDGETWKEEGRAVARGQTGAFDDRSVFTPEILEHEGRFYLVYQAIKAPYLRQIFNHIGMAVAESPYGPWEKLPNPILSPAMNGVWDKDHPHSRHYANPRGDFDSHKVHDPTLVFYKDHFRLYYKGQIMGERNTFGGRDVRWGVAMSDRPEGPYVKSPYNPISNSGHELAIWPWRGGFGGLITTDGPEANTVQWAPDGINFEIMAHLKTAGKAVPQALGIYRASLEEQPDPVGLTWGLSHESQKGFGHITQYIVTQPKIVDSEYKFLPISAPEKLD